MTKAREGSLYGSIPHMAGSRLGPKERTIHAGQQAILESGKKGYTITVQEKLDGSCVGVLMTDTGPVALTRKGHLCKDSPYFQHYIFESIVNQVASVFSTLLKPGERLVGEFLAEAHGTKYRLEPTRVPWFVFDKFTTSGERILQDELKDVIRAVGLFSPRTIYSGKGLSLADAKGKIPELERTGLAVDPMEGFVYRAEHGDKVEFLAKYVRPSHEPGIYLPEVRLVTEMLDELPPPTWNWPTAQAIWAQALERANSKEDQELAAERGDKETNAES